MRCAALFLVGLLLSSPAGLLAGARRPPLPSDPVSAIAGGRAVRGVILVQIENAPCLSLRDLQRLVGGRVVWKRVAREASLMIEGRTTRFVLDSAQAEVDGKTVPLDVPVRWWTGQAYVPLSFLLTPDFQAFAGVTATWEPERKMLALMAVPDISSPRFTTRTNGVLVVFDLASRVDYRVLRHDRSGLLVRFFGGSAGSRERLQVQDTLVTAVDVLPRTRSTDVMFHLGEEAGLPFVTLETDPRRLVVEVRRGVDAPPLAGGNTGEEIPAIPLDEDTPVLLPGPAPRPAAGFGTGPAPAPAVFEKKDAGKNGGAAASMRVVVIDPGHGGKDAGAVGRGGTLEKNINLSVAKEMARALQKAGYETHMTRTGDEFLSLQERAEFANKLKADLFISVHCNAALSRNSNGFEIYFLSENASDDAAAAVARRENAAMDLEGPADKVQAKVAQLLWSLAQTETLNESSEFAALVHKHAQKDLGVETRGVKQAGFYVLKWARMPAVLVESAFITNPKEENLLRSSRYAEKLAQAVLKGVKDYERRRAPGKNAGRGGP